jgi:hypothetical protein
MNTPSTLVGLENQALPMGRLHVILRRQSGRVTDIEYMRIDPVYCRYLLKLAGELDNDDLDQICKKLEEVYFGLEGLFVCAPRKMPLLAQFNATSERRTTPPPSRPDAAA